jgi:death-on-curing protein
MIILTSEQISSIHSMLIQKTGGLDGVRDVNLLDSAIKAPFQTFGGEELYSTIHKKAACLCYGLVNNHAFIDGNKRIGILVMSIFLEINDVEIEYTDEELVQLGLGAAAGKISQEMILNWITDRLN